MNEFGITLTIAIIAMMIIFFLLVCLYVSTVLAREIEFKNKDLETEISNLNNELRYERRKSQKLQNRE